MTTQRLGAWVKVSRDVFEDQAKTFGRRVRESYVMDGCVEVERTYELWDPDHRGRTPDLPRCGVPLPLWASKGDYVLPVGHEGKHRPEQHPDDDATEDRIERLEAEVHRLLSRDVESRLAYTEGRLNTLSDALDRIAGRTPWANKVGE